MKKLTIVATLVMMLLTSTISTKPIKAWNGGTHSWTCESARYVLEWNARWQNKPELLEAVHLLERTADAKDPSGKNRWNKGTPYWQILQRGAADADLLAYNSDGTFKHYHFKKKLLIVTIEFKFPSNTDIGGMPWWLAPLKILLWPITVIHGHTKWAVIDQFQKGMTNEHLYIPLCRNLRTAKKTGSDYFYLAKKAWNNGNEPLAMWWLGMASHMIQDCATPFHAKVSLTWLAKAVLAYKRLCDDADVEHERWGMRHAEEWEGMPLIEYLYREKNCDYDPALKWTPPSFMDHGFFDYGNNWNVEKLVGETAEFAQIYSKFCDNWGFESSEITSMNGLSAAQLRTAQLVYLFFKEIGTPQTETPPRGITLTYPNGGETWSVGTLRTITWTPSGLFCLPYVVDIELSRDGGLTWTSLIAGTPNDGSETLWITGPETNQARIRVWGGCVIDSSDDNFTITNKPSLTVISPNGGENWLVGSTQTIRWTSSGITGNVNIELSGDGGMTWTTMISNTPNDGSEPWQVTGPGTSQSSIRVSSGPVSDTSDGNFTIVGVTPIRITVTSPNGGENWQMGTNQRITWTSSGIPSSNPVKIELSLNGGSNWETIIPSTPDDGSEPWHVAFSATLNRTDRARIRVSSGPISDTSDGNFTIAGVTPIRITVTSPNGGENWQMGSTHTITWASSTFGGNVTIELSRDGGSTWTTLFSAIANDGSEPWQVTGPGTSQARIKISSGSASDTSDSNFTIVGFEPAPLFREEFFRWAGMSEPAFTGAPILVRDGRSINYDWGEMGPTWDVGPDYFLARWTGIVDFAGGNYTFTARVDDGIRLWVDGNLLIDEWRPQVGTEFTATRSLTSGMHEIKVEYFERMGLAICQVSWQKQP